MNILFCIYQLDFADHIALAYLSAIARKRGHSTHLCVLKETDLSEKVRVIKPEIIAYSGLVVGFDALVAANREARREHDFIAIMGV